MSHRVFNFSAGPAALPLPVLQRVQEETGNYEGLGASIFEISHFSPEFKALLYETETLMRELLDVPATHRITFAHGGGLMQFAMVPMNLAARKPARKLLYVETGNFSRRAMEEGARFGTVEVVASSADTGFDRVPELDPARIDGEGSYLHITTNNTIEGTQWQAFPASPVPLVGDATSDLMSRPMDIARFGILYAAAQKNMGPPGLAVAFVHEDLLGHALPFTPKMLNYAQLARDHSLSNTTNTFTLYVMNRMLHWMRDAGGLAAVAADNERKAALVYGALEAHEGFYRLHARPGHRSGVNVVFRIGEAGGEPYSEAELRFVSEARAQGMLALKGHRDLGGLRASMYNGMPLEGARALADFIHDFARRNG